MNREEILVKLKEIFQMVVHNGVNIDLLDENSDVKYDLGVNSVGLIYIVVAIEKVFNIDMSSVTMNTFKTVKDVVDFIENGGK